MDSTTIALASGPSVGVALLGLFGLIYQSRKNARSASNATDVQQQNANTTEFDVMRQGFVASIAEMRLTIAEVKAEAKADREKSAVEILKLSERIDSQSAQKDLIIQHVITLESMIPFPPGPPLRPAWN